MSNLLKITNKRNFKEQLDKEATCLVFLEMNQMSAFHWQQFKNEVFTKLPEVHMKVLQKKVINQYFFYDNGNSSLQGSYCVVFCNSSFDVKQIVQIAESYSGLLCIGGSDTKQFFSKLDLVQYVSKDKVGNFQLLFQNLSPSSIHSLSFPMMKLCMILSHRTKNLHC